MDEGEMVTENFIISKTRPVARNLKVKANLSSTDKESLITVSFLVKYGVIFLSSSLQSLSFWFRVLVQRGLLQLLCSFPHVSSRNQ